MIKTLQLIFVLILFFQCKEKQKSDMPFNSDANTKFGTLYEANVDQSIIYWSGSSATGSHNGTLKLKNAKLEIDESGQLKGGTFIIDMMSISDLDIENPEDKKDLENHLKNGDFFAVDTFPEADFVIRSVRTNTDSLSNSMVTGDLTIRGVVHSIDIPATVISSGGTALITVPEFSIDRTLWNINYHSSKITDLIKDELISDKIGISMKILAVKK